MWLVISVSLATSSIVVLDDVIMRVGRSVGVNAPSLKFPDLGVSSDRTDCASEGGGETEFISRSEPGWRTP